MRERDGENSPAKVTRVKTKNPIHLGFSSRYISASLSKAVPLVLIPSANYDVVRWLQYIINILNFSVFEAVGIISPLDFWRLKLTLNIQKKKIENLVPASLYVVDPYWPAKQSIMSSFWSVELDNFIWTYFLAFAFISSRNCFLVPVVSFFFFWQFCWW